MTLDRSHLVVGVGCLILGTAVGLSLEFPRGIPFVGKKKEKAIGLYSGDSPLRVSPHPGVANPILTADDITDFEAEYVTDPFVLREGSAWYMFFGVRRRDTGRGAIGLATSDDGLAWKYRRIVLEEPFHTSYPQVFRWQGGYYLVPESPEAGAVRLYRAQNFPTEWVFVETLLEGNYADPSLFRFDETWWMFAESNPQGDDRLSLFHAGDLKGPWLEHPMSPIVDGNGHIARPGGRVIRFENRLVRFTQDDEPEYGRKVWAFEITQLTTKRYEERRVGERPVLREGEMAWNNRGMHHLDPHQLAPGSWLAFVSGHGESVAIGARY